VRPEEVGVSSKKLDWIGDEIVEWVASGELVGAQLLIVKDGKAIFHEAYGWVQFRLCRAFYDMDTLLPVARRGHHGLRLHALGAFVPTRLHRFAVSVKSEMV
jgi:hypothetical protein